MYTQKDDSNHLLTN